MRTVNWLLGLLLLVLVTGAGAEDVISEAPNPYTERGVSITKYVEGSSLAFTNKASEPWYPVSLWVGSTSANTVSVDIIRIYGLTFQTKADTVDTNFLGQVVTNQWPQVTNLLTRVFTNTILNGVVTSTATNIAVDKVFYIKADDLIRIRQSETNGKPAVINGQR